MESAIGGLLWDGAVALAQNPIALLSIMISMGVMFTMAAIYEN
jgi:hypothetical protein